MTWKAVPGFDGKYEASDGGQIRSTRHYSKRRYKIKKARLDKDGYLRVQLVGKNSKMLTRHVHRLVAEAFIGPRPDGRQVCHNNGDKTDNRLENLRYGTAKENSGDRAKHGTAPKGERNGFSRLSASDVVAIRCAYIPGEVTQRELATQFGTCPSNISHIVTRRAWKGIA